MKNFVQTMAGLILVTLASPDSQAGSLSKLTKMVEATPKARGEWFSRGAYGRSADQVYDKLQTLKGRVRSSDGDNHLQYGDNLIVRHPESNTVQGISPIYEGNSQPVMRFFAMTAPPKNRFSASQKFGYFFQDMQMIAVIEEYDTILGSLRIQKNVKPVKTDLGAFRQTEGVFVKTGDDAESTLRVSIGPMNGVSDDYLLTFDSSTSRGEGIPFLDPKDFDWFKPGHPLHAEIPVEGNRMTVYTVAEDGRGRPVFYSTEFKFDVDDPSLAYQERFEYIGDKKLSLKEARRLGLIAEVTDYTPRASGVRSGGMRRAATDSTSSIGEAR